MRLRELLREVRDNFRENVPLIFYTGEQPGDPQTLQGFLSSDWKLSVAPEYAVDLDWWKTHTVSRASDVKDFITHAASKYPARALNMNSKELGRLLNLFEMVDKPEDTVTSVGLLIVRDFLPECVFSLNNVTFENNLQYEVEK